MQLLVLQIIYLFVLQITKYIRRKGGSTDLLASLLLN